MFKNIKTKIKNIFTSDAQKHINTALDDYLKPINDARPGTFDVSKYTVTKPWGEETWLDLTKDYAFKVITMTKGCQSSLQSHDFKTEANYVIKGKAKVLIEENGQMVEHFYEKGEGWVVPVGVKHRVIAITEYTAVEVSTPHLNDVVRYQDDANRTSGKISTEHGR